MKISCHRENLLTAFQTVAPVVPARSPKPILQNIKLEAASDTALLTATDLEQGICYEVSGIEIETSGSTLLPLQQFGSILRETTDEVLRLESDSHGTLVKGQRSEFRLPAGDPHEFPTLPQVADQVHCEISGRLFREMIRRTIFAIDPDNNRYALGGILFEMGPKSMTAVATDGRRLSRMEGPARMAMAAAEGETQGPGELVQIVVPGRGTSLMERALSDTDSEIRLVARASDVMVKGERATVYSRLLEGRFPPWREVLPVRQDVERIDLPVGPFHMAVRQAAIITNSESRGIDFQFREGELVLAGRTADVGQARVELPIGYAGREISIILDPRYLSEFLRVLDPEKSVSLELKDSETAAVLRTDDGYAYVVMPLSRDRTQL
jgi:DNA polymerase-3 subunit beta